MKPLVLIVGLILAAGAGALGGVLVAPAAPVTVVEPVRPAPASAAELPAHVRERMDALAMEVADLQSQLAALRQESSRRPAATETAAVAPLASDAVAALHRDVIVRVLAEERAAEEARREEEQRLRNVQQDEARAERVASRLAMSPGQKQLLVQYYDLERQRAQDLRAQFREGTLTPDVNPRDVAREANEWRSSELTSRFGTDLAAQILESDGDRWAGQGQPNARRVQRGDGQGAGRGAGAGRRAEGPGSPAGGQ